jgi:hypothetical protein
VPIRVSAADPTTLAFVALPVCLALALAFGIGVAWRRSGETAPRAVRAALLTLVAAAIWMAVTWRLAGSGWLRRWDLTPPPFLMFLIVILVLAFRIAFSGAGRRLAREIPLWVLVGVQGFRLPLELAMHQLYERGIMPIQMSYTGMNFDIVTGATAFVVAALLAAGRAGIRLAFAWNVVGAVLLLNILVVAVLSTPKFHAFGQDRVNVFVTYRPYVWLPAVMVLAALAGHLLIWRAIRLKSGGTMIP